MLDRVTLAEVEAIAIGAGILGTGGGGSPYHGSIHLRQVVKALGPQALIAPKSLADDARLAMVGMIGAPTASIEKLKEGTELLRAIRLLEEHAGFRLDAVVIAEIGGSNSIGPLIAGLQAGIPTVDADGMGRAFPELQMSSFLFHGDIAITPLAMTDAGDSGAVIPTTTSAVWAERLARNLATSMGASAGLACVLMSGAQVKAYCVPHTLSLAHRLGERVLAAQSAGEDVPEVIASGLGGRLLLRGKVSDVFRRTTRGFARGNLTIEGFGAERSQSLENWAMAVPGLKVAAPSTPRDVVGLLAASVRDPDPVVFFEHKKLFAIKEEVPDGEIVDRLGTAAVRRAGSDVTIVALAAMVPVALEAAESLAAAGVSAEVIDLRTLVPLDTASFIESVSRTGRLVTVEENPRLCGWGAEIASIVAEECLWDLDGPVVRVTTPHIPLPAAAELEDLAIPSADQVVDAVMAMA